MNQVQEQSEQVFHQQDLVVWHSHTASYAFPIPGVVIRQEENSVIIRARVEGSIQEFVVSPDELVAR